MAQEWAKSFYTGKAWKQTSRAYMLSKAYVCERCGGVGEICHHKKWLNSRNINDPAITLSFDNLECLCKECHNKEHMLKNNLTYFNEAGEVERVKESGAITEFKQQQKEIDKLLKKMTAQNGAGATQKQ